MSSGFRTVNSAIMPGLGILLVPCVVINILASQADFSAYEKDIVERRPFGVTPPAPPPPPPPAPKEPPSVIDSLDIVAITDGVRVGFINRKNKKEYYLSVGEEEDGIKVEAIYPELETVLFEAAGKQKKRTMSQTGGRFSSVASTGTMTDGGEGKNQKTGDRRQVSSPVLSSYKERLKARQEALRKKREEEKNQMTREQFRALYEEFQKEKTEKKNKDGENSGGQSEKKSR